MPLSRLEARRRFFDRLVAREGVSVKEGTALGGLSHSVVVSEELLGAAGGSGAGGAGETTNPLSSWRGMISWPLPMVPTASPI